MAQIPISAYYYSDEEKAIILDKLKPITETDCYLFGNIETSKIAALKSEGILIDIHQDLKRTATGIRRGLSSSRENRRSVRLFSSISEKPLLPAKTSLYVIQLIGPLHDSWKAALQENEVSFLERLEPNIYKVITPNEAALSKQAFIQDFRPFGATDKEFVMQRSVSSDFAIFGTDTRVSGFYDVRLLKDTSLPKFLEFLKEKEIPVLAKSRVKIRVELSKEEELILLGQREDVQGIEEYIKPVLHNNIARQLIHVDVEPDQNFISDLKLTGQGELVAVADTGIDREHPDLKDNLLRATAWGRANDTSDPNGHGTHVAGSVVGNGSASNGTVRGIAPEASLFFQSLLDETGGIGGIPHDLSELFQEAYEAGARIHNNSWGSATESEYRFNSLEVDEFVYNHKDMLLVISAGNEGTAFQPRNSAPGFVDWLSLGSPATAKNALTIGASRSTRTQGGFSKLSYGMAWPTEYPEPPVKDAKVSGDPESMAAFSSRGPCGNESRIKPDVVAPGTDIASTKSAQAPADNFWGPYPKNRNYAFLGGTSMAAPIVSGFAALIRQYLREEKEYPTPSAALLKTIIINSTRKLKSEDSLADHDVIPNFHQGFGCIDLLNILPSLQKKELQLYFRDSWQNKSLQFSSAGEYFLFQLEVNEGTPLRLCLCWTDPPGNGLQNNLNLLLFRKSDERKWVGNEALPRMITSFDRDNNAEIIRIEDPLKGEYRVAVQANNLLVGGQDFALTVTGDIPNDLKQLK